MPSNVKKTPPKKKGRKNTFSDYTPESLYFWWSRLSPELRVNGNYLESLFYTFGIKCVRQTFEAFMKRHNFQERLDKELSEPSLVLEHKTPDEVVKMNLHLQAQTLKVLTDLVRASGSAAVKLLNWQSFDGEPVSLTQIQLVLETSVMALEKSVEVSEKLQGLMKEVDGLVPQRGDKVVDFADHLLKQVNK